MNSSQIKISILKLFQPENEYPYMTPRIALNTAYIKDPTRRKSMQVFIYCKITLRVSGVDRTHHQEYIKH